MMNMQTRVCRHHQQQGDDADIAELLLMTQTTSAAGFETDALSAWSCR
jgi:hypothetical protein